MASKNKRPANRDLKAASGKRNVWFQVGATVGVIVFAVALIGWIVLSSDKKQPGEVQPIRVVASDVVTGEGTGEPKAVVSIYEDFQCPHCAAFEKAFGPTMNKLIDSGAIAADYYAISILNSPINDKYSTRAANAAYCVADADTTPNKDSFRRFHAALFAQQPAEGTPAPNNEALIEIARQAGVVGTVPECVNSGKYSDMVDGLAEATGIKATPTVRINGDDYQFSTPDALIAKVKEIVGDVPGLAGAAATAN